jgi:hypothetical protein
MNFKELGYNFYQSHDVFSQKVLFKDSTAAHAQTAIQCGTFHVLMR